MSMEGVQAGRARAAARREAEGVPGIFSTQMTCFLLGGAVGALVAKLFGEEPDGQLQTDLRRFKQVIETGEVVISDATVAGEGYTEQRPAQPLGVGLGAGRLQK